MAFFKSLVDKIKQGFEKGLEKTRETFISGVQGLRNLLLGRKLDEALIDELHRTMLQADVGAEHDHAAHRPDPRRLSQRQDGAGRAGP